MPYRERMLLFLGLGILLIGAGWLMLSGWPEALAPKPAADPQPAPAATAEAPPEEGETAGEHETPAAAVEGEVHQTEPEGHAESPLPTEGETVARAPEEPPLEAPTVEAPPAAEPEGNSFPLPEEITPPPVDERNAPIEMVVVRETPEAEGQLVPDGEGEAPEEKVTPVEAAQE